MKKNSLLSAICVVVCAGAFGGCAASVPIELTNAREAYRRASLGPAAEVAQAELHIANQSLAQAENSFQHDSDSYRTRDLAYVAQRKSELATATAAITIEKKNQSQAKSDYEATQAKIVTDTKESLSQTQTALSAEQSARAVAEKNAADALAALAKLGSVKEEPRGTVITLSGSVLFASNQSTLLPEARTRLDQVLAVLLTTRERNITVEGHTDSQGTDANNLALSQRRADAVRNYLVQGSYQADLVKAQGLGEGTPIADNASAEGRANNRRVEIVINRQAHASNP
jgi:outer membrane protein OmpA-like peptidoglycan-associated protein